LKKPNLYETDIQSNNVSQNFFKGELVRFLKTKITASFCMYGEGRRVPSCPCSVWREQIPPSSISDLFLSNMRPHAPPLPPPPRHILTSKNIHYEGGRGRFRGKISQLSSIYFILMILADITARYIQHKGRQETTVHNNPALQRTNAENSKQIFPE
jgi:hypothetical protein